MGIGVYIELGGIHTLTSPDSVVDLYTTFNQAESQNKSDNIKFGLRQRMKSGKTILNHSQFLGYTKRTRRYIAGGPGGGGDRTEDI